MDESKQPKTARTVADALREMPVGTRFTRPIYRTTAPWEKTDDDVFTDGDTTMTGRRFGFLDRPHDDPIYGIVILSTPDAVPPTQVRCWHDNGHGQLWAMKDGDCGLWFYPWTKAIAATCETITSLEHPASGLAHASITPAAALDLLKDWPEGRERFLAYCREHPPVEETTPTVDVTCTDCGTDNPNPLKPEQPASTPALQNLLHECDVIGSWLSAALDDADSCDKFKADIHRFLDATNAVVESGVTPKPVEQPAGVVVTREWLAVVAAELELASLMHHGKMLGGYDADATMQRRDNCARLAADARRKSEPQ